MMRAFKETWIPAVSASLSVLALAVFLLSPLIVSQYWVFFILQMVVSAYLALSFSLAYSYSKILSFCQGLFFGVGAYATIYLASAAPWGLPMVLLAAMAAAAAVGAILGAVLVRMDSHGATIATVILASAAYLIGNASSAYTGGEDGVRIASSSVGVAAWNIPIGSNLAMYYVAVVPLMAIILAMWAFRNTIPWKVLQAVASNEIRAQQLGFNVSFRRFVMFTVSAAIAGLGGAFYALLMGHVTTAVLNIALSVNAILWAVVGGAGTAFGPLIGVLAIYPVTEAIAKVFVYVQILIGLILVVVAIAFPRGIMGTLHELGQRHAKAPRSRAKDGKTVSAAAGSAATDPAR